MLGAVWRGKEVDQEVKQEVMKEEGEGKVAAEDMDVEGAGDESGAKAKSRAKMLKKATGGREIAFSSGKQADEDDDDDDESDGSFNPGP